MNREDVAKLLTIVSSYDRRTLGEADVVSWHEAIGDLSFEECRGSVVRHYAEKTDWLMPAHVRRLALVARQDAAMRALPAGGDDLVPQPDWFQATAAEHKRRTREENRLRVERGERPYYGETVMRPSDWRPR